MTDLEKFAAGELELIRKLPFGEWLRHVRRSHERLCRMVLQSSRQDEPPVTVEIITPGAECGSAVTRTVYALPADCHRICVEPRNGVRRAVRGFRRSLDNSVNENAQVEAEFIRQSQDYPIAADCAREVVMMTSAEQLASRKPTHRECRGTHVRQDVPRRGPWDCQLGARRLALGLTLQDIAEAVGLTQSALFQVEHGSGPTLKTAFKLATFFGCTVEALWPGRRPDADNFSDSGDDRPVSGA